MSPINVDLLRNASAKIPSISEITSHSASAFEFKMEKTITDLLSWGHKMPNSKREYPPNNKKFHFFNDQSVLPQREVGMLLEAQAKFRLGTENTSQMGASLS